MRETQQTINEWQDRMFPNATREGVTKHLIEELEEFQDALEKLSAPHTVDDLFVALEEASDVVILIYAWARKNGIVDFHKVGVDHKMGINRVRDWNIQPDGTGRHK